MGTWAGGRATLPSVLRRSCHRSLGNSESFQGMCRYWADFVQDPERAGIKILLHHLGHVWRLQASAVPGGTGMAVALLPGGGGSGGRQQPPRLRRGRSEAHSLQFPRVPGRAASQRPFSAHSPCYWRLLLHVSVPARHEITSQRHASSNALSQAVSRLNPN